MWEHLCHWNHLCNSITHTFLTETTGAHFCQSELCPSKSLGSVNHSPPSETLIIALKRSPVSECKWQHRVKTEGETPHFPTWRVFPCEDPSLEFAYVSPANSGQTRSSQPWSTHPTEHLRLLFTLVTAPFPLPTHPSRAEWAFSKGLEVSYKIFIK